MYKWKRHILAEIIVFLVCSIPIFLSIFFYTPEYAGVGKLAGLKEILDHKRNFSVSTLMLFLLSFSILSLIYFVYTKFQNKFDDLLNVNIDLEQTKQTLISQLRKGNEISNQEKIKKALELFVLNNGNIISVQLYKYTSSVKKNRIYYEVSPTGLEYTSRGNVTNLIHEHYSLLQSLQNNYLKAKLEFENGNITVLEKLIKKITDQLLKYETNHSKINDDAVSKYAILILSLQTYLGQVDFKINHLSEQLQKKLQSIKRTGFLRGLVENNYYKFKHNGENSKKNRIYITRCLPVENVPHLFVIALNPNVEEVDIIGEKFYEILSSELNVVYNNYAS